MRTRNVHAVTAVMAMFASLSSAFAASPEQALQTKGQALVTEHCRRCHAIAQSDASQHEYAPPFRDVILRYPAENLAEALAEGIVSGHPDMPVLTFEIDEIDAMIAYLNTLNPSSISP
jgi:cytochrome c